MTDSNEKEIRKFFEDLAEKWPSSLVARDQMKAFSGGAISCGRLANLDCQGQGPESFRLGRKRVYPVKSLIEWLIARSEPVARKARP